MKNNKGKYKVGKVSDHLETRGWFFGQFAKDPLLYSNLVEVAWRDVSNKTPLPKDEHLHTSSVEINTVISGEVKITINEKRFTIHKGEYYVIWPETTVKDVEASDNTVILVVRAPSVNDKVIKDSF